MGSKGGKIPHCFSKWSGPPCEESGKPAACNCRDLRGGASRVLVCQAPSRVTGCMVHIQQLQRSQCPKARNTGAAGRAC